MCTIMKEAEISALITMNITSQAGNICTSGGGAPSMSIPITTHPTEIRNGKWSLI